MDRVHKLHLSLFLSDQIALEVVYIALKKKTAKFENKIMSTTNSIQRHSIAGKIIFVLPNYVFIYIQFFFVIQYATVVLTLM